MNISNYYWYFSGVLTPRFCDDVIAYANGQKEVMARTGGYGDKKLNKQEVLDLKIKNFRFLKRGICLIHILVIISELNMVLI